MLNWKYEPWNVSTTINKCYGNMSHSNYITKWSSNISAMWHYQSIYLLLCLHFRVHNFNLAVKYGLDYAWPMRAKLVTHENVCPRTFKTNPHLDESCIITTLLLKFFKPKRLWQHISRTQINALYICPQCFTNELTRCEHYFTILLEAELLYQPLCLSVSRLGGWSVCWSVGLSNVRV